MCKSPFQIKTGGGLKFRELEGGGNLEEHGQCTCPHASGLPLGQHAAAVLTGDGVSGLGSGGLKVEVASETSAVLSAVAPMDRHSK